LIPRDSYARILNPETNLMSAGEFLGGYGELYLAAICKFDRVTQKVAQYLPQPVGIANDNARNAFIDSVGQV